MERAEDVISKNRQIDRIFIFCGGHINKYLGIGTKDYCQPLPLLWKRYGTWLIWIAHSNVVCLQFVDTFEIQKKTIFFCNSVFTVAQLDLAKWNCNFILNSRLPFEWRNPSVYLLVVFMQCISIAYKFSLIAGIASYGIGCFLFAMKTTEEIQSFLELLNEKLKTEDDLQRSVRFVSKFVHCHSLLKQLGFLLLIILILLNL